MKTIKIEGRDYEVIETGIEHIPYKFKQLNGNQVLLGALHYEGEHIAVLNQNKKSHVIEYFLASDTQKLFVTH